MPSEEKTHSQKLNAVILGSGKIGSDLLVKLLNSDFIKCNALIGRDPSSKSKDFAENLGVKYSAEGIEFVKKNPSLCEIVFDATSARAHEVHAPILKKLGIIAIDLTPAKIGPMCIPSVNTAEMLAYDNINMVTCGGQASIPIAYALGQSHSDIEYIEVVSSIASLSAGAATRHNLDEYIHTTESGIQKFSGAQRVKAILNLNPAQPCIDMQTTVFAKVEKPNLEVFKSVLDGIVEKIKSHIPGYKVILGPIVENGRIVTMVRVQGRGDFLPSYAGNLDIINCAAVEMAEEFAKRKLSV